MKRRLIVEGDLLARMNIAQGVKLYVPVENFHEAVGRARMIDVVRAVAATAAVKAPLRIDGADAQHAPVRSTLRFRVRD